jgi:hypothetical protein
VGVLAVTAAVCALGSCGSAGPVAPSPSARPTYLLPPRTVRPSETPLALPPATAGPTDFTLIGLTSLPAIQGSHAEMAPKGRYLRIRLEVVNTGRSGTTFDTTHQQLVTADGVAHDVDPQAMLIRRQPDRFDLGSGVRVEFDLYYDIPVDARPVALRVHGGPTLSDLLDAQYRDIPLTPPR